MSIVLSDPKRLRTRRGYGYLVSWKHRLKVRGNERATAMVERLLADPANVASLRAGIGRPEATEAELAEWLITGLSSGALELLKTRVRPPVMDAPPETNLFDLLPPEEPRQQLDSLTFEVTDGAGEGLPLRYVVHAPSGQPTGSLAPGERRFVGDLTRDAEVEVELSAIQLPLHEDTNDDRRAEPPPLGPDGTEPLRPSPDPPVHPDGTEHAPTPSDTALEGPLHWLELGVPKLDVYIENGAMLLPRACVPGIAALFRTLGDTPRSLMVGSVGESSPRTRERAQIAGALLTGSGWASLAQEHHSARELTAYLRWAADEFGLGSAADESELEDEEDGSSSGFEAVFSESLASFREDFNQLYDASIDEGAHEVGEADWDAMESLILQAVATRLACSADEVESYRERLDLVAAVDGALTRPSIRDFDPLEGDRVDVFVFPPGVGHDLTPENAAERVYGSEKLVAIRVDFTIEDRHHRFPKAPAPVEVVVRDALGRPSPGVRVQSLASGASNIAETDEQGMVRIELTAGEESARVSIVDYEPKLLSELAPTTETPTPGSFYQLRSGDTLLQVVGQAYGLPEGSSRLERAKAVNANPWNRHYWVAPSSDFDASHFPGGRISFMPAWDGAIEREDQAGTGGRDFATIYLPEFGS